MYLNCQIPTIYYDNNMKKREKYVKIIISFPLASNLMSLEFGLAHVSPSRVAAIG